MTMIDAEDILKRVARPKALLNQANAECFSNLDKAVMKGEETQMVSEAKVCEMALYSGY